MSTTSADPRGVIEHINGAWRAGRAEEAAPLFAADVVMVTPDGGRVVGRDALVRSYVEFAAAAVIDEYAESEHSVDVFGDTAIVGYRWTMAWRAGGEAYRDRGRDLFVLARRNGGWQVVWRTLLPEGERG